MTLNKELIRLRQQLKVQEKGILRLQKENTLLEEASAFFAVGPEVGKTKDGETKEDSTFY